MTILSLSCAEKWKLTEFTKNDGVFITTRFLKRWISLPHIRTCKHISCILQFYLARLLDRIVLMFFLESVNIKEWRSFLSLKVSSPVKHVLAYFLGSLLFQLWVGNFRKSFLKSTLGWLNCYFIYIKMDKLKICQPQSPVQVLLDSHPNRWHVLPPLWCRYGGLIVSKVGRSRPTL